MKRALKTVLFLNTALVAPALLSPAWAAGYGLKEQSAAAMGAAYAGVAADLSNPASLSYNPATLAGVADTDFAISLVEIVPHSSALYTTHTTALGTPTSGNASPQNFIADAPIPDIAIRHRLSDDLSVGLSVSVPYGLKTNYPTGWAGRYYATKTEAITINIAPSIAWQATPQLTFGAAVNVEYARGQLESAIDIGTIGFANHIPGSVPGGMDGSARLSGMSWETGFTLGAIWQPSSDLSFGAAYKSAITHNLTGPFTFTLDSFGVGAAIRGATGLFTNTRASAHITMPDMLEFGARWKMSDNFTLMSEFDWTNWSRFKNLNVVAVNPAQPSDFTLANWKSSVFFSAGGEYRLSDNFKLRVGAGFDESPVPDATRTPRIPDASRTWLAGGVEYRLSPSSAINLSYGRLFDDNSNIVQTSAGSGNTLRGNLTGATSSMVDVVGLQVSSAL